MRGLAIIVYRKWNGVYGDYAVYAGNTIIKRFDTEEQAKEFVKAIDNCYTPPLFRLIKEKENKNEK